MRRRRFLGGCATAALTAAVAPILATTRARAEVPVLRLGAQRGLVYRVLTDDPAWVDARPCDSPDGHHVLFMRSPVDDQERSGGPPPVQGAGPRAAVMRSLASESRYVC